WPQPSHADRRDPPSVQGLARATEGFHFLGGQGKQLVQANQVVGIGRGVERQPLDPSLVARERKPPQEVVVRKGDTPRENGPSTHLHLDGAGCQGSSSCLLDPRGRRREGRGPLTSA